MGVLAASLALLLALPAAAQWRWRDANGRVTASDRPPPREIPDKDILQRPAAAARPTANAAPANTAASAAVVAASGPASAPVDKDLQARKKAAEAEQQAKAKAEEQRNAAIRADNCARARSHLATLDSGQRLARINDKGEREVLDDAARAAEVRRARDVIASDCR
ncbi:MAG: DUF4124 domain-containing protein [Proteobacteria bacterium]|nr:DUF4124 domain-containing protein [Pseudomonadota bacterium]